MSIDIHALDGPDARHIIRSTITSIERRTGTEPIGRPAVITGVIAGAVAGWALGASARSSDERNGGLLIKDFPYRTVGTVVGALGGLAVGTIVAHIEVAQWQSLSVNAVLVR
jgi:hypothetical protein